MMRTAAHQTNGFTLRLQTRRGEQSENHNCGHCAWDLHRFNRFYSNLNATPRVNLQSGDPQSEI